MINNLTPHLDNFEVPTPELRRLIRAVAAEDGVTFASAMRTYEGLVKWARKEHRALQNSVRITKHDYSLTPDQVEGMIEEGEDEVIRRVFAMRATLKMTFANAVRNYTMTDYQGTFSTPEGVKRPCQKPGCKKFCAPDSYYRCVVHKEDQGTDDGDLVYMVPPPHGISLQVRKAGEKMKAEEEEADE